MITRKQLMSTLDYNPSTGILTWKIHPSRAVKAGDKVTNTSSHGYIRVKIQGREYLAHRLIWLYVYGYLPKCIDHIDRNRSNNKLANLREATYQNNSHNMGPRKKGSSKYKGVCWCKRRSRWQAEITIRGYCKYLGHYKVEQDAALAYNKAAKRFHGKFAYLNTVDKI